MQKWFFLIVTLLGLSRASAEEQKRLYVARLVDEQNRRVQSEKVVEVDFDDGQPVQAGDQFGL